MKIQVQKVIGVSEGECRANDIERGKDRNRQGVMDGKRELVNPDCMSIGRSHVRSAQIWIDGKDKKWQQGLGVSGDALYCSGKLLSTTGYAHALLAFTQWKIAAASSRTVRLETCSAFCPPPTVDFQMTSSELPRFWILQEWDANIEITAQKQDIPRNVAAFMHEACSF